jgi:hypothetical protein
MAQIIQFPRITNDLEKCAGCQQPLTENYYQVELPISAGEIKHIGLCESCHADAAAIGIFG